MAAELRQIRERAEALARRVGLEVATGDDYQPHRCWRCSAEMIVYAWPGGGWHDTAQPPVPVPSSVMRRWTEGAGDYWANCCPRCSAVQGDHFLGTGNATYAWVRRVVADDGAPHSDTFAEG